MAKNGEVCKDKVGSLKASETSEGQCCKKFLFTIDVEV